MIYYNFQINRSYCWAQENLSRLELLSENSRRERWKLRQRSLKGRSINDTLVHPFASLRRARRRFWSWRKRKEIKVEIYGKKRKRSRAADGIYCSRRKYSEGVASTLLSSRKWKPTPRRVYFNVYSLGSYNGTTSYNVTLLPVLKKNCFHW